MAQRPIFQLSLIFVALASVDSTTLKSQSFFKEFYVSQPLGGSWQDTIYIITKQNRKINKAAARNTCYKLGGYPAKLGDTREYNHIRNSIIESGLQGRIFEIGEANKDTPRLMRYPFMHEENCTFFTDMTGSKNFNVMVFSPCDYTGHLICELRIRTSELESTKDLPSTDPKLMLQRFRVSPIYKGRVYLGSIHAHAFDIWRENRLCEAYGGYLLEFDTKNEYNFVKRVYTPLGNLHFTGGNDLATEGVYKWLHSGRSVSMTDGTSFPWASNNPDDWEGEDCLVLWYKTGEINDLDCRKEGKYICEVPIDANE